MDQDKTTIKPELRGEVEKFVAELNGEGRLYRDDLRFHNEQYTRLDHTHENRRHHEDMAVRASVRLQITERAIHSLNRILEHTT